MLKIALRNILSRKLRFLLTALAIILGTAMMSGTYVLTDQITGAFDEIFEKANEGVDVVIARQQEFESNQGTQPEPFDESIVAQVASTPGVDAAEGQLGGNASVVVDGDPVTSIGGAPALLLSTAQDERFNVALPVSEGRLPSSLGEIAVDESYADRGSLTVGQSVEVTTETGLHPATLVGIFRFGDSGSLGGATLTAATTEQVQRWTNRVGEVSLIVVAGTPGTDPAVLKNRIAQDLPEDRFRIETGDESADRQAAEVNDGIGFLRTVLSIFALVAILVGAFVIFNVFSITVAQRIREIAMLRTIGATRSQLRLSVITEAVILGLVASIIGVAGGVFLAVGLKKAFEAAGFGLPTAALQVHPRTIIIPILVGVIATVVAVIVPAVRATRIPPVSALREGATLPRSRFARYVPVLGVLATLGGIALVAAGFVSDGSLTTRLSQIGFGAALIVIGIGLAMRLMIRPLAGAVGAPLAALFGTSARIARRNAVRDTSRTASTSTALMIGVGLVVFIAVFVHGFKSSIFDAIDKTIVSQVVTLNENFSPMPLGVVAAAESSPSVESALGIAVVEAQVDGSNAAPSGIDPTESLEHVRWDWQGGATDDDLINLGADGAIVEEGYAADRGLAVDDRFTVVSIDGQKASYTVRGIYRDPQLFTDFTLSTEGIERLTARPQVQVLLATFRDGVDETVGAEQLSETIKEEYPLAKVRTREEYKDFINTTLSGFLNVLYALLALSVLISLIGVVITLLLAVYERTREIGMLRAIGTTRRQVRAMILNEGVIMCVIGGIVGVGVGLLLGWLIITGLSDEGLTFSVPIGTLITVLVLTIIAGLLSAFLPARRASKLRPLDALHYE